MAASIERGGQGRLKSGWYTLWRFVLIGRFMGSPERNMEREVSEKQGGGEGSRGKGLRGGELCEVGKRPPTSTGFPPATERPICSRERPKCNISESGRASNDLPPPSNSISSARRMGTSKSLNAVYYDYDVAGTRYHSMI